MMKLAEFRKQAREFADEPSSERRQQRAKQLYDCFGRRWIERTRLLKKYDPPQLCGPTTREFSFKHVPGRELKILIDYPSDWQASDHRPAIIFWHGGGFMHGNVDEFFPQAQYFASRGMVVARAEYRLRDLDCCLPVASVEDGISAVRFLKQRTAEFGINAERIVAAGGSAGGCIAAAITTMDYIEFAQRGWIGRDEEMNLSPRPCAMLLFNPYVDFFDSYNDRQHWEECVLVGQDPRAAEPLLHMISATEHLRPGVAPSLTMMGTRDPFFPQQLRWITRCADLHTDACGFIYRGQVHGWFNASPHLEYTTENADRFLVEHGLLPPASGRETDWLRRNAPTEIPQAYSLPHTVDWEQHDAIQSLARNHNIRFIDPPVQ